MKKYKYYLKNLDCANCASKLERTLQKINQIENVSVNFMTQKLQFDCSEENISNALENIKKIIKKEEPNVKLEESK